MRQFTYFMFLVSLGGAACSDDSRSTATRARGSAPAASAEPPSARARAGSLNIDGKTRPVEEIKLSIDLRTWKMPDERGVSVHGDYTAGYFLHVRVDERSGEDGAPAPDAVIPVFRAAGERHPELRSELPGLGVDDRGDWEAWFGNDAPALEDNELLFGQWRGDRIWISWAATYENGKPFLLEGEAAFEGISISGSSESGVRDAMGSIFGPAYLARLKAGVPVWRDLAGVKPDERKRVVEMRYSLRPR